MPLLNYTPHKVTINSYGLMKDFPSMGIARVSAKEVEINDFEEIPVIQQIFDDKIEGLPDPKPGVGYIVSRMVAMAARNRDDLFVPARLQRDSEGNIVGAEALEKIQ